MEYIPYYITERSDFKPGHVVTADEFNGWVNRLAIQGDGNTDILVELVESANDHEERMDVAEDKLESIEMVPVYEEGVNVGSFTFNNETVNIYAPVAGEVVQSDWGQSDTNAVDYIKNKPAIKKGLNNSVSMGYGTKASGTYQVVLGMHNIESNGYPLIVGNGTSSSSSSNALTVDWNGDVNYDNASRSLIKNVNGVSLYNIGSFSNNVISSDLAPDERVDLVSVGISAIKEFIPEAETVHNSGSSYSYVNGSDSNYMRDLLSRRACLEVYFKNSVNSNILRLPLNITRDGDDYYQMLFQSDPRTIRPVLYDFDGASWRLQYSTSTCIIPVADLSSVPYIYNYIGRFKLLLGEPSWTLSYISGAYATNCLTQDITTGEYEVGEPSGHSFGSLAITDIRIKTGY